MLAYLKAFLVFIGLIKEAKDALEKEIEREKIRQAEDKAKESGDTSDLEDLASE